MNYREKIDQLAGAMAAQDYQPVFEGNPDAAVEYMDDFTNTVLAYYQSVLACGLFNNLRALGPMEDEQAQEEELFRKQDEAREAAAKALDDLNRVCLSYGEEPLADIDTSDPDAMHAFVGEFCSELSRQEE